MAGARVRGTGTWRLLIRLSWSAQQLPRDPLPLCPLVQAQVLQRPRHSASRAPPGLQQRGARLGAGMCTSPNCCAPVAEGRPSPGRRTTVVLGCPGDIPPLCLMVLLKVLLGPSLGASRPSLSHGSCAGPHWGLIEILAPVQERTGASLKSWLCGTALGALCTYGPSAGSHWDLFEAVAPVQDHIGALEVMAPVRERTGASLYV